jgi:hypothetical protein
MSLYHGCRTLTHRFRLILSSFLQSDGLPFGDTLSEGEVERAFNEENVPLWSSDEDEDEDIVYTPAVTLWAFLSQMLHRGEHRSCVAAVSRVVVLLVALGREPCSSNTGAYCRARAKLPEKVLRRLTLHMAAGCEQEAPSQWLWHGRHVKLVDGTTVSMPDTDANQAEYPQQTSQEEGLGFPIVRMVLLFSLATGMLCDMAMGPYQGKETGEPALFRELLDQLVEGDIVLADRFYCSYFMIALLMALGVDFVVRLHQARTADFRRGRHLGKADHVVTSLCDAEEYASEEIAELYRSRWLVELDIRAVKITLDMDVLRCKTPEMVRRELWTHLLAYNLIRRTILQSAQASGLSPRELSFTAAMQAIAASWAIAALDDSRTLTLLVDAHLANLAGHRVGHRPNRVEPRAVKRRPKPHRLLTKPRAEARAELLANAST